MNETIESSDPWKVQCYDEIYSLLIKKLKYLDPELNFFNIEDLYQFNLLIEVLNYAIDNQLNSEKVNTLSDILHNIVKSKSKYCQENKMASIMDQIDYTKIGIAVLGVMVIATVGY